MNVARKAYAPLIAAALIAGSTAIAQAATITITMTPLAAHDAVSSVALVSQCKDPNSAAAIDGEPMFEYPNVAQQFHLTGITSVAISISNKGNVESAQVMSSSGASALDYAALRSARLTKFVAERSNCQAISGRYELAVDYEE